MPVSIPKGEQITFFAQSTGQQIELLVNPETLTILFRKIYDRKRTKTRLVTFFWGEEPVKFVYRGQTGNLYPTIDQLTAGISSQQNALVSQKKSLQDQITKLQTEIFRGGPYSGGSIQANQTLILQLSTQLNNTSAQLFTGTNSSSTLQTQLSNTQIISLTDKFQVMKSLESMYRTHQNPSDALVRVWYRDYIFDGYFESFSFTDDAKSPWNWIYNIDFTILDWQENPAVIMKAVGEIVFPTSANVSTSSVNTPATTLPQVVP